VWQGFSETRLDFFKGRPSHPDRPIPIRAVGVARNFIEWRSPKFDAQVSEKPAYSLPEPWDPIRTQIDHFRRAVERDWLTNHATGTWASTYSAMLVGWGSGAPASFSPSRWKSIASAISRSLPLRFDRSRHNLANRGRTPTDCRQPVRILRAICCGGLHSETSPPAAARSRVGR